MALKVIEGLFTIFAAVEGFTGGTAELADEAGVVRMAVWTGDRLFLLEQSGMAYLLYRRWRRDTISP